MDFSPGKEPPNHPRVLNSPKIKGQDPSGFQWKHLRSSVHRSKLFVEHFPPGPRNLGARQDPFIQLHASFPVATTARARPWPLEANNELGNLPGRYTTNKKTTSKGTNHKNKHSTNRAFPYVPTPTKQKPPSAPALRKARARRASEDHGVVLRERQRVAVAPHRRRAVAAEPGPQ